MSIVRKSIWCPLFVVLLTSLIAPRAAAGSTYKNGYQYRRAIVLSHAKVPNSDQTNFPVLFSGVYSYLATVSNGGLVQNANGYDIVFSLDPEGATILDHEIETYDPVTGTVNFWITIPTLSHTVDTVFYLFYGNSSVTLSQENKAGVWQNGYVSVYHLPNGSTLSVADSLNANNGTNQGATPIAGIADGAADFNGSSSYVTLPAAAFGNYPTSGSTTSYSLSYEAWFQTTSSGVLLGQTDGTAPGGSPTGWVPSLYVDTAGHIRASMFWHGSTGAQLVSTKTYNDNHWHFVVDTYSNDSESLYVDGQLINTQSVSETSYSSTYSYFLGTGDTGSWASGSGTWFYLNGAIDEVRTSGSARAADWIATEYAAQSSPSTFYAVESQSTPGSPPTIQLLFPAAGIVGNVVTIQGFSFQDSQGSSTVTFNGITASPTSWNDASIKAPVPTGTTTGNVIVTVGGVASNGVQFTLLPTPNITSLSMTTGAVGASVTITGTNFGTAQGTVTFNGTTASSVTNWTTTQIVVSVPSGATTGPVVVTASGIASNGVTFTVVPAPQITSVSPTTGAAGGSVTIKGANFGTTQGSGTVTFYGTTAGTISSWSTSQIVVLVPPGAETGPLVVHASGVASNGVTFTILATPSIASVSPSSGGVGTPVTITGTNFGEAQGSSKVTFNGTAGAVQSWAASQIVVPVPAAATTGPVIVTVGGVASNAVTFTVNSAPSITKLSPNLGPVGTTVTITGNNFGASQGTGSSVTFNGIPASPTTWTNTSIKASVPSNASTGPVVVTVGGLSSNGATFTVSSAPTITSLSPNIGPVGTSVTVSGENFGTSKGSSSVTFNGTNATPTTWGNASIKVPVPAGATTGAVVVTVGGVSSNGVLFTVGSTPSITSLSPSSGTVGSPVTIGGANFGNVQGGSLVTFNGVVAAPTSWSSNSISVLVPTGAKTGSVVVNVAGIASNASPFTVTTTPPVPPALTSLFPTSGPAGTQVEISGSNFGTTPGSSTVTFNGVQAAPAWWAPGYIITTVPNGAITGNVVVTVGGSGSNGLNFIVGPTPSITQQNYLGAAGASATISGSNFGASPGTLTFNGTVVSTTAWSANHITFTVPSTAVTGTASLVVSVSGMVSNTATFNVIPAISNISPDLASVGTQVTINGSNFGSTQGNSLIYFPAATGTVTASPVTWSNTAIVVAVPSGAISGNVYGLIGNQYQLNSVWFTVGSAPAITSLSPTTGSVGTRVTISGSNFGSNPSAGAVTLNGSQIGYFSWSPTSIVTVVPQGATTGNVVVSVGGVASNRINFTVTAGPGISGVSPTTGGIGTIVQVVGSGFGTSQGTSSTLTFNGTVAPSSSLSWSDTVITGPVPTGATTGNVVVNVGGVASNGIPFTVQSAPTIQSLSQASGSVGQPIVISGYSFGGMQNGSTVTFNGNIATPTAWSQTQITVPVPASATTGNVVVTVGGTASNGVNFTVTPGITSLSPLIAQVGTSITINGSSFGPTKGSSSVYIGYDFNGIPGSPTQWTNTQIIVPVPSGVPSGGNVYVWVVVGGVSSNRSPLEIGSAPSLTSLSPTSGPVGSPVTITGNNIQDGVASFNGIQAENLVAATNTQRVVIVPSGATTGNVVVSTNTVPSNSLPFKVTPGPGLNTLNPATGAVGRVIELRGANFGSSAGTLTFNGIAASASFWSDTDIDVPVPAGATTGNVVVTVGGVPSNALPFTVVPVAVITSLSATAGGSPSGTPLVITGKNFGSTPGVVRFGTTSYGASTWTNTSITMTVVSGQTPVTVPVTVIATGTGIASNAVLFTILGSPSIQGFSPSSGPVGTQVTISSSPGSFGDTQSNSTVTFNGALVTPISWSSNTIVTTVPSATVGSTAKVVVTVNGNPSPPALFSVTPTITSISPNPAAAGVPVTVTGTGFGSNIILPPALCGGFAYTSLVTFNGTVAHPTSWTPTSITVLLPNTATTGPVLVNTCLNNVSNSMTFNVTPAGGTISGTITNALSKMAASGVTVTALQSGTTIASTTTTLNGSYSIPNLATGTYDLQVGGSGYITALKTGNSITAGATTTINLALSTAPIVSSVSPAFGGVGTSVTIVGSNFGPNQADSTGSVTFNGVTATPTNWSTSSIVVPVPTGATTGPLVVSVGGVASNATTFNINGGSLTGIVTDAAKGQPVSGAAIQALSSHVPQGNTTSSPNGSYTISNLPSGTYDMVVSAASLGSVLITGQVVTVGSATTVNVALPAAGTDSGTITNGTTGIPSGTVSAIQNGDVVSTATTNASGAFLMSNLGAGTYSMQASAPGYAAQTTAGIGITAGQTTTTNFSLSGQPVITYDYDALGRLVGVVDSLTGSAVYNYDAVGNVTSIQRLSSAQVVIISFSPASGLVGSSVTMNGNNFSSTASQNTVRFNGTAATVVTASSTQLVVKVPSGATTGPISVTTPAGSASSATAFAVQAAGTSTTPIITGISPPVAGIGDTVTITGTNFDPTPENDGVTLNGSRGIAVVAATATSLSVVIPAGATTGRISVATAAGSATSANYLFVAPAPYAASSVGYHGQITSLPGSQTMSIGTNQIGILAFDGIANQAVTLLTSSSSFPNNCAVPGVLISPIGTDLFSFTPNGCFGGNSIVGATPLPESGTYVVLLGPDTGGAGGVNVAVGNVQPILTGYLWLDGSVGPTVPVNIQTWGQQALFTFNGTAQQTATLHVTQNTIPGVGIGVFSPDGTLIASIGTGSSSFNLSLGTLSMTGSYLVKIVPNNGTQFIGNLTVSVTSP